MMHLPGESTLPMLKGIFVVIFFWASNCSRIESCKGKEALELCVGSTAFLIENLYLVLPCFLKAVLSVWFGEGGVEWLLHSYRTKV